MCKLLISYGVDVLYLDNKKRSALHFAKKNNRQNVVELLNSYKIKEKKIKEIEKVK
jgi:ankyrin repeat protein